MPIYSQGDIFDKAPEKDLTTVFGYFNCFLSGTLVGLQSLLHANKINKRVIRFCHQQAIEFQPNHWIWLIPLETGQGLSDAEFKYQLDQAIQWAAQNKLKTIITNGARDSCIDDLHFRVASVTRKRANYLRKLAKEYEQKYSLSIELIDKYYWFKRLNKWINH